MTVPPGIVAVVPAFNEAPVIGAVVEGLVRAGVDVVVVDDGSGDGTGEAARRAGAVLLRHPVNRGQGAAIQTGIDYSLRMGARYVVTFDADGQHHPLDVHRMVGALVDSGADVALGSRFAGFAHGIPASRKALLKLATLFTNLTTGVHLSDTHNGLRVMTAEAARTVRIRQDGMAHASEIIEQIASKRLRYVEVPVTVRYTEYSRKKGQSGTGFVRVLYDLLARRLQ